MAIVFSSKIADSTNEHTVNNYYTGMSPVPFPFPFYLHLPSSPLVSTDGDH